MDPRRVGLYDSEQSLRAGALRRSLTVRDSWLLATVLLGFVFHEDYIAAELDAVGSVNTPVLARFVAGSSNSLPRQVWSDETGRCVAQTKLRWARPVDEYTSHVTHVTDIRCPFLCNGLHRTLLLPGV